MDPSFERVAGFFFERLEKPERLERPELLKLLELLKCSSHSSHSSTQVLIVFSQKGCTFVEFLKTIYGVLQGAERIGKPVRIRRCRATV